MLAFLRFDLAQFLRLLLYLNPPLVVVLVCVHEVHVLVLGQILLCVFTRVVGVATLGIFPLVAYLTSSCPLCEGVLRHLSPW